MVVGEFGSDFSVNSSGIRAMDEEWQIGRGN